MNDFENDNIQIEVSNINQTSTYRSIITDLTKPQYWAIKVGTAWYFTIFIIPSVDNQTLQISMQPGITNQYWFESFDHLPKPIFDRDINNSNISS